MANISDIIEQYLLSCIGGDDVLCISRNGLANYFNCSPSQINYVISTRFTLDRGYMVESKRGGGGYLILMKMPKGEENYIQTLLQGEIGESITYLRAANILKKLFADEVITEREMDVILSMMNDKTLFFSDDVKSKLRANMLKSALTKILQDQHREG